MSASLVGSEMCIRDSRDHDVAHPRPDNAHREQIIPFRALTQPLTLTHEYYHCLHCAHLGVNTG
eukprot:14327690-Alexandrium_andersonii.AAC.1